MRPKSDGPVEFVDVLDIYGTSVKDATLVLFCCLTVSIYVKDVE